MALASISYRHKYRTQLQSNLTLIKKILIRIILYCTRFTVKSCYSILGNAKIVKRKMAITIDRKPVQSIPTKTWLSLISVVGSVSDPIKHFSTFKNTPPTPPHPTALYLVFPLRGFWSDASWRSVCAEWWISVGSFSHHGTDAMFRHLRRSICHL